VDHNVSAWVDTELAGALAVCRVGIGDAQREVGTAMCVSADDGVEAFGSFVVALLLLRIARAPANPHAIDLEHLAIRVESHGVGRFDDEDAVRCGRRDCRLQWMDGERERCSNKDE